MTDFWKNDEVATGPNFWDKDQKVGSSEKKPEVGVGEDVAKGAVSGATQGAIAIPGMVGDVQSLAKSANNKVGDPLGWVAHKFEGTQLGQFLKGESEKTMKQSPGLARTGDTMVSDTQFPTSADIQKKVEGATGPFYQAQTPAGKAVQTAASIVPALATGGEGLVPTIAKAAGAGAGSEAAGEAANALKGHLPDAAQPWAEPVARAAGTLPGMFLPGGARRAVTPLPMTDERMTTVNALRGTNPELVNASSAGQLTESPRVMALEGRAPRMANLPQRQGEAYTQGVMAQAGAPGAMFDTPGLAQAKGTGTQIEALRNAHSMSPAEFAALNQDVNRMGRPGSDLYRAVGPSTPFTEAQDAIRLGPTGGNPVPLNMTGQRYGALKQSLQRASEGAPTSHEQIAIANARARMNQAFHNSMPADEAARLRGLDQNYSNYKTIENIPTKAGENTITPDQVNSKAPRGSELETHANQAASVMTPLPERKTEISPLLQTGAAVGNSILHGAAGLHYGGPAAGLGGAGEGFLGGLFGAEPAVNAAKDMAGRAVASRPVQAYLKNQQWRPGTATSVNNENILRLLMTPPVTNALPNNR